MSVAYPVALSAETVATGSAAGPLTAATAQGPLARLVRLLGIDTGLVVTIGSRGVGILAGLLSSIVTARFLLPSGRGEYFLVITTAQLVAQFTSLGLPSSNTYFVARERELFPGLLVNSVWISFLAVPVMAGLFLAIAPSSLSATADPALRGFALALAPLLVFQLLGSSLFVGLNQLKTFGLLQAMGSALALPFMVIAAVLGSGPRGFLAANLVGTGGTIVVMLVLLRRQSPGLFRFTFDVLALTFKYSAKAYLATLAGFIVLRMNVFLLHAVAGPEQVGYYSIASQISDPIAILPQSIALVLFPQLAALRVGRLRATLRHAAGTALVLALICTALWVFADPAIRLAFGVRFAPAAPVLRAMLPGVVLLGVLSVVSQYLAASGFPPSVVLSWFGAVAVSGTLGRVLVVRYGAFGAAETLSITYALLLIVLLWLCWRNHHHE